MVEAFRFAEARGVPLLRAGRRLEPAGRRPRASTRWCCACASAASSRGRERRRGRRRREPSSCARARASAGTTSWRARSAEGWAGVECLSGIPGDVGATPIQNVGAYGQEVAETIVEVRGDRPRDGRGRRRSPARTAASATATAGSSARARAVRHHGGHVRAAPGRRRRRCATPSSARARRAGGGRRAAARRGAAARCSRCAAASRWCSIPADENAPERGVVLHEPDARRGRRRGRRSRASRRRACSRPARRSRSIPAAGGRVKLSAAWLIERAGFAKGTRRRRRRASRRATRSRSSTAAAPRRRSSSPSRGACVAACSTGSAWRSRPSPNLVGFAPGEIDNLASGAHAADQGG